MIDWHCHILPGLDDGAASADESLLMSAFLADVGFTHVCCTPHRLRGMYDTTPASMRQGVKSLQDQIREEGVSLVLLPGMEYCLDEFFVHDFSSEPVTLGSTRKVLVETPSNADPQLLRENIFYLVRNGYVPLFAHPERHAFLAPPAKHSRSMFGRISEWGKGEGSGSGDGIVGTLLEELQMMGCEFQGNLGSVEGYYGSLVRQQESRLRKAGCYACYGSDGHNVKSLQQFLKPALQAVMESKKELLENQSDLIAP